MSIGRYEGHTIQRIHDSRIHGYTMGTNETVHSQLRTQSRYHYTALPVLEGMNLGIKKEWAGL